MNINRKNKELLKREEMFEIRELLKNTNSHVQSVGNVCLNNIFEKIRKQTLMELKYTLFSKGESGGYFKRSIEVYNSKDFLEKYFLELKENPNEISIRKEKKAKKTILTFSKSFEKNQELLTINSVDKLVGQIILTLRNCGGYHIGDKLTVNYENLIQ